MDILKDISSLEEESNIIFISQISSSLKTTLYLSRTNPHPLTLNIHSISPRKSLGIASCFIRYLFFLELLPDWFPHHGRCCIIINNLCPVVLIWFTTTVPNYVVLTPFFGVWESSAAPSPPISAVSFWGGVFLFLYRNYFTFTLPWDPHNNIPCVILFLHAGNQKIVLKWTVTISP